MNFVEFYEQVTAMKQELMKRGYNLEEITVSYTRFNGKDCLWCMKGNEVIIYFKW